MDLAWLSRGVSPGIVSLKIETTFRFQTPYLVSTADGASRGYHRGQYTLNQTKRHWSEAGLEAFAYWAITSSLAYARLLDPTLA